MPALAPPPAAASLPTPSEIDLPAISFFGRSLAEYAAFFALDPAALRGRDVLDVGAGASSFVAEARARRIDAVAVDPQYGASADALATHAGRDCERTLAQIRAKPRQYRCRPFRTLAEAEADRRGAVQRFLNDYATHFVHGRYVGGALPRLPFFDGTFDLVLCAHLLFTYASRFDFDWHLAACRELVRVSAGEVRIHPVCGLDGKPYASLARLRRELKESGIASELRAVDYEFFAGATSMLVLRKVQS